MKINGKNYTAVWMERGAVCMIDQKILPHEFKVVKFSNHKATARAITDMTVRGAGSIGVAAGFGAAQVVLEGADKTDRRSYFKKGFDTLRKARPTAQDPFAAISRIEFVIQGIVDPVALKQVALLEAQAISDEYVENGRKLGVFGNALIKKGATVLTHCNAGWLALQDWGSALAPIYAAHRAGKKVMVYADETRPRMQGMKLTAWELAQEGVPFAVIPDNAAAYYMRQGKIDLVITGADRIAMNGDAANKIGTYEKALCAKAHGIPFYIAAPLSTFDPQCRTGAEIPIEERSGDEVVFVTGRTAKGKTETVRVAPEGITALNPAFDVTPAHCITAFITNAGIVKPNQVKKLLN